VVKALGELYDYAVDAERLRDANHFVARLLREAAKKEAGRQTIGKSREKFGESANQL